MGIKKKFTEEIPQWLADEINNYINNPNTRVFINHNNDTGVWYYSIEVDEGYLAGNGFWLASFKTKREAEKYIKNNNLKLI